MKNIFFAIIFLPLFLAIYLIDRAILACLPWMNILGVQKWLEKGENAAQSIIRVLVVGIITLLTILVTSFFN